MAPQDVLLAFLICSSFSNLFQTQKAEAAARTMDSLSHCKKKCGETEIPYPFGMKKGCYLDESFEITCNDSTGSATLVLFMVKVDSISLSSHSIRFKGISVRNLPFKKSEESKYDLSFFTDLGNPYSFSYAKNKFVAIGCNFIAYILDDETKDFIAGCASLCNSTDIPSNPPSSCSGQKCCQMNIHKDISNFTINIEALNTTTKSWKCGFFTFMDKDFPINKLNFSACEDEYTVPVIFEWSIGNTSCKKAVGRENYICGHNTDCIESNIGRGYRCKCRHGFTGNPYILDGCQDIDECANQKDNKCPVQNHCVNTEGGYMCLLNRGHMSVLLVTLGCTLALLFSPFNFMIEISTKDSFGSMDKINNSR